MIGIKKMSEYYECHITLKGHRDRIKSAVEKQNWKFSCIDGDPVFGDGVLCYATKHYANTIDKNKVIQYMNETANNLLSDEFEIIRQKVEYVVYDTKSKTTGDKQNNELSTGVSLAVKELSTFFKAIESYEERNS